MPGPSAKVPEDSISSLELVRKICSSDASHHNKATMVQLFFDAALNEELELLAMSTQELEIDERDARIVGPVTRGNLRGVVVATVSACRAKFVTLLREHKRDIE